MPFSTYASNKILNRIFLPRIKKSLVGGIVHQKSLLQILYNFVTPFLVCRLPLGQKKKYLPLMQKNWTYRLLTEYLYIIIMDYATEKVVNLQLHCFCNLVFQITNCKPKSQEWVKVFGCTLYSFFIFKMKNLSKNAMVSQ